MRRSRKINAGRERGNEPKRGNGAAGRKKGNETKRENRTRDGRRETRRNEKTERGTKRKSEKQDG